VKKNITFLFIFSSFQLIAQNNKILLPGKTYNFEIKDGTNRSGKLDSITADYYYIDNPAMGPVSNVSIKWTKKGLN
jgi:hypothetical protein